MDIDGIFHGLSIGGAGPKPVQSSPSDHCSFHFGHSRREGALMLLQPRGPFRLGRRLRLIAAGGMKDVIIVNVVDRAYIGRSRESDFNVTHETSPNPGIPRV